MPSESKTDRPTGTIFELDLFVREGLDRMISEKESAGFEMLADQLRVIQSNLIPLIDNVQKQYVHTASPESDGAAGETGDCDACGKTFAADELIFQAYGEGGNHVADGSFCPDCNGTPLPNPPTEGGAEGPFKIEIVTGGAIVTGPCMDDPPHPPVPTHLAEEARDLYNRIYAAGASARGSGEAAFIRAGTPESEALCFSGDHFAAHHIGGTTWRFGSGDECRDDQVGTITLAPPGYTEYGCATARWIVNALDRLAAQPNPKNGEN